MLGVYFMLLHQFHKYSSLCAVCISADMICNVNTLLNNQLECLAFSLLFREHISSKLLFFLNYLRLRSVQVHVH